MIKRRYRELADYHWLFNQEDDGSMTRDQIELLLLMDIRAELKRLNDTLGSLPPRSTARKGRPAGRRSAR